MRSTSDCRHSQPSPRPNESAQFFATRSKRSSANRHCEFPLALGEGWECRQSDVDRITTSSPLVLLPPASYDTTAYLYCFARAWELLPTRGAENAVRLILGLLRWDEAALVDHRQRQKALNFGRFAD